MLHKRRQRCALATIVRHCYECFGIRDSGKRSTGANVPPCSVPRSLQQKPLHPLTIAAGGAGAAPHVTPFGSRTRYRKH